MPIHCKRILLLALALLMLIGGCVQAAVAPVKTAPVPRTPPLADRVPTRAPLPSYTPQPTPASKLPYTFVWMTDTQHYSDAYPEVFHSMTQWIADKRDMLDIRAVIHTGDIVNSRRQEHQWENARAALVHLQGTAPLIMLAGNHDIGSAGRDYARYGSFLTELELRNEQTFEEGKGQYLLLDVYEDSYLFLALSYATGEEAMDWADAVLRRYPAHRAILLTHNYLHNARGKLSGEGARIFDRLVAPHPNVRLVLCGHNRGAGARVTELDDDGDGLTDRTVYQIIANYQSIAHGGNGYMGIFTVDPNARTLKFITYSPYLDDTVCFDSRPEREDYVLESFFAE